MRGEADKKDNARRIEKSAGLMEIKDSDKSGTFVAEACLVFLFLTVINLEKHTSRHRKNEHVIKQQYRRAGRLARIRESAASRLSASNNSYAQGDSSR